MMIAKIEISLVEVLTKKYRMCGLWYIWQKFALQRTLVFM